MRRKIKWSIGFRIWEVIDSSHCDDSMDFVFMFIRTIFTKAILTGMG